MIGGGGRIGRGTPRMSAGARWAYALLALALACAVYLALTAPVSADTTWSLEQPSPPPAPAGGSGSTIPIALGRVGDIEFWAPNRGLLITAGNPPTIPPGVWAYDGAGWHELASVCGASDGRIAWAGPEEFWTISDGRPGQSSESSEVLQQPPLEDNTLCHFAGGQVVGSYAHPAFQADSYLPMHAAGCFDPSDCWFAGDPLEEPQIGAFQLHWNGDAVQAEPYPAEGHAVQDMRQLEGIIYEGVGISSGDRVSTPNPEPPAVHRVNPSGILPAFEPETEVPLYGAGERPEALEALRLSASDSTLWGAAGPKRSEGGAPGQVTVVRRVEGFWSQLIGPEHPLAAILPGDPAEEERLLGRKPKESSLSIAANASVAAIAAEPGTGTAWVALDPSESSSVNRAQARAVLVHVSADGQVLEERTLPSDAEREAGVGPKGAAAKLACPAVNDCWLASAQGWLFHLAPAGERGQPKDEDPAFAGPITYRPPDQGLPQVAADAPPPDTSGLVEEPPNYGTVLAETNGAPIETTVTVPLLANLHSRLIGGRTLELRFHLAVKARVRLLAKRHKRLVASTPMRTLPAGAHRLLLRLNPRAWPTKLSLQTHALAPLPTSTVKEPAAGGGPEHASNGSGTVSTGLNVLPHVPTFAGLGSRP
jgi:hypothetical protein